MSKYDEKISIWIVISDFGMSLPYFQKSGYAIDHYMLRDECLEPYYHLLKKIKSKINLCFGQIKLLLIMQFWSEICSILSKFNFCQKILYPANLLKVHPIEDFWDILKAKVY